MRITLRLIISLLLTTAAVVLSFSYVQTRGEETRLNEDLSLRASLIARSFRETIEPFIEQTEQPQRIRQFIEKFRGGSRLIGTIVQMNGGEAIAFPNEAQTWDLFHVKLKEVTESKQPLEWLGHWEGKPIHLYALPIQKNENVVGALGVIHDRSYIIRRITDTWKRLAVTFSILALILSVTTLLMIRWSITGPIARIAEMVRKATGQEGFALESSLKDKGEIEKLFLAVGQMASHLKAARLDLAQQARLANSSGIIWTKERLRDYLKTKLNGKQLYVVANREPYIHRKVNGSVECITPASGVVTGLDPVLKAADGMWLAHGAGDADRETVDAQNKLRVPPAKPAYTLKRIWLNAAEEKGYYYGFSNEGLWPLCHISHVRPIFRIEDWQIYKAVNQKFADALLAELDDKPSMILVQDYHFALLPKLIKDKRPDVKVALFWHIPWPNSEAFGICPWQEEILDGMLGADLIGFHTQYHCNNFLDTVDQVLESRIDWTSFGVIRGGKTSYVRPFPISVDYTASAEEKTQSLAFDLDAVRRKMGLEGMRIGVGVDRIDYTKGLLERFRAIERLLDKYPSWQGKVVFVEFGAPSRTEIEDYKSHMADIDRLVDKINTRFKNGSYQPIRFLKEHHGHEAIQNLYKIADFCLVSSLHDGMNLVAKEFAAARSDEGGVLILSRFTGASHELTSALQINPYDIEGTAETIHQALTMHPEEVRERMRKLRTNLQEYNIYRWAAEMITELVKAF